MRIDKIKTFLKTLKFKDYIFLYILCYSIMPIVSVATSKFLTTYFYMIVVVISVGFTLYACRLNDVKEFVFLLIPFLIYRILYMIMTGDENFLLAGYQVLLFLLPVCLGYYINSHQEKAGFYSVFLAVIFAVTAITTIIGCIRNPDAARILATTETSQDPTAISYGWQNIGGYGFVYTATLLYPCVILAYKMRKLPLIIAILFGILALALAVYAEYSYAMMLVLVSTLLFFLRRNITLKKFILLMLLFIAVVVLFKTGVAAILTKLGRFLGNDAMMEKINVLFLGTDSVEGFDDNRDQLYMLSINTFLSHPFFGTFTSGGKGSGGHSFILDNLAQFGLLGGILLFLMYRGIYKIFYRPYAKVPGFGFIFWIFLQPLLLSSINTGMWVLNLTVLAPIVFNAVVPKELIPDIKSAAPKKRTIRRLTDKEA